MTIKPPVSPNTPLGTGRVFYNAQADYGARGDGSTDDTSAIQAALNAANNAGGGDVFLTPGQTYKAHGLSMDNFTDVRLIGGGDTLQSGAIILSSSTGSTSVLSMKSASGCGLVGTRVENNSASFTGKILDLTKAVSPDTSLIHIERCYLRAVSQASSSVDLLTLTNSYGITIEKCRFYGGRYAIVGRAGSSDYSNSQYVGRCYFELQDVAAIYKPGITWTVESNTFEPSRSGAPNAVLCDTTVTATGMYFAGNWTGDQTTAGAWIDYAGSGLVCIGNRFDGNAVANTIGIRALDNVTGLTAIGNIFDHLAKGIDLNSKSLQSVVLVGNRYPSTTTPINGTSFGSGSLILGPDATFKATSATTMQLTTDLQFPTGANCTIYQDAAASSTTFLNRGAVSGEANDRYRLQANGDITRGPGGATAPTTIFKRGTGTPEGVVTAGIGSIFQREDGGAGTSFYVKESGAGNVGWVAK